VISSYWQTYQNYVYPFYPALVTLDQFSVALFEFLDQRPSMDRGDLSYDSVDSAWMALLFAVLALGVQFSEDLIKERDLRSKVFSTCLG
jgi:predicted alternative tryptophan synthase beta-subunit